MHQGCQRLDSKQRLISQYLRVQTVVEATSDAQQSENKKDGMPAIRLNVVAHLSRNPARAAWPCRLIRARSEHR
jgi:hypothetical protein